MKTHFNPLRTLVVDDSPAECVLLKVSLQSIDSIKLIGFVHDGTEAIAYLRGNGQFKDRRMFPYPDLMLLDFNMPRCGGMEVLQFVQPPLCRPRIVLWSNTLENVCVPLALRLGADMVCHKPADKHELKTIIDGLCQKSSPARPLLPLRHKAGRLCMNV